MKIKTIITFIGGLVIGGGVGIFGTKKYFEEKYQKRYEEDHNALEEYYHRTDEYYRRDDSDEDDEENEVNPTESDSRPGGRMSQDERKKYKEKLNEIYGTKTTNYAGMYKTEIEFAESEHPLDQEEEDETEEISLEEEAFNEHQKNKDRPPKIISAETYSNLPGYIDQTILYFYAYDEVLCDENEEAVEEPERLIGDALTKYGFVDNDERIIFVMNYAIDTCYEIQKVDASWTDSH